MKKWNSFFPVVVTLQNTRAHVGAPNGSNVLVIVRRVVD